MTELNTLIGVPKGFDTSSLEAGKTYTVLKERERAFPLHIAMLVVDTDWNIYGYGAANSTVCRDRMTTIEFTMLTLFSPEEQELYKSKFVEAAKITGEVK